MARSPQDPYDPTTKRNPTLEAPSDYLSVRSSPNQFGAATGQAVERLGGEVGKVGDRLTQVAIEQQGMINETLSTDAETQAAAAYGKALGEYKSLQGLAAVGALPKVVTELQSIRQKIRATLPNSAAQRSFDMMAGRREAFALEDVNSYAATQVKKADMTSAQSSLDVSVDSAADPTIARSDLQFYNEVGNVKFQTARVVNNMGYTDMSKEDAKAVYNDKLSESLGKIWINRIRTVALDPTSGNVNDAVKMLNDNKDKIPSAAYAQISASLVGPYREGQSRDIADGTLMHYDNDYQNQIGTVPSTDVKSEGVQTIISGLFPGATVTSTLRTPEKNTEVGGVDGSFHLSNEAIDFTLPAGTDWATAKAQIKSMGLPITELINEGDHVHVAWGIRGKEPVSRAGYISKADYYRINYDKIISSAREEAEDKGFGQTFVDQAVSRTEQRINDVIRTQDLSVRADQNTVLKAINDQKAPITSLEGLINNPDPKVRAAWDNVMLNNPYAAQGIQTKILTTNSRGQANDYGKGFQEQLMRVLSGSVSDPDDLLPYVHADKNSPLTNRGFAHLNELMGKLSTPTGKAQAQQELAFFKQVQSGFTSQIPGVNTPGLTEKFNETVQQLLPRIESELSAGKTPQQIFDPKSADYVGKIVKYPSFTEKTKAEMDAQLSGPVKATASGLQYNSLSDLQKAVRGNPKLRDEAIKYGISKGWLREVPPPVPFSAGQQAGKSQADSVAKESIMKDTALKHKFGDHAVQNFDYGELINRNPLAYLGFLQGKTDNIHEFKSNASVLGVTYQSDYKDDSKVDPFEKQLLKEAGIDPKKAKNHIMLGPEFKEYGGAMEHELMHRGLQALRDMGIKDKEVAEFLNLDEHDFISAQKNLYGFGDHRSHPNELDKYTEQSEKINKNYLKPGAKPISGKELAGVLTKDRLDKLQKFITVILKAKMPWLK